MAIKPEVIDRLKAQLLTSGIQQQNQPLFQVINQLIDAVRSATVTATETAAGSGVSFGQSFITEGNELGSLPNSRQLVAGAGIELNPAPAGRMVISTAIPFGMDSGGEGEDGPPGPPGRDGAIGPVGPAGSNAISQFYGYDGIDGEDAPIIPGPQGIQGVPGSTGSIGMPGVPGLDGEDGLDSFLPGPSGPAGNTGAAGLQGPPGMDAEEPNEPLMIPGPQGASGTGGGGSATLTDFTKDLGAGDNAGTFDITGLSGLTPNKNVLIVQTMQKISSKGDARDEFEMQPIILTGYVLDANTIRALWNCDAVCVGTYAFAYMVSA